MRKPIDPLNVRIENATRCLSAATAILSAPNALNTDMLANVNDCIISGYEQAEPEMNALARKGVGDVENSRLVRTVVESNVEDFKQFLTKWKTQYAPNNY